jgi:hypothetical protein
MTAKPKDTAWVGRMGRHGVQILAVVLVLALVFTMVNVQQFAAQGHPQFGVQWFIAWLLDPMASLTMAAAIVYEGLLADYGKPKVHWLTATKWYAGVATWGMNIWSSAAAGSFAGIWLHSVAPGLVLLLAEAAPRVRRHMANIIDELEHELAPVTAKPEPVVELPAPTYARVGPASWTAPAAPAWRSAVPPPAPVADSEPVAKPAGSVGAGVAEPAPTPEPTPAPVRAPEPPRVTPSPTAAPATDDELATRVRKLLNGASGPTPGRRTIAKQLGITEHQARTALELVGATTGPTLNGSAGPKHRSNGRDSR